MVKKGIIFAAFVADHISPPVISGWREHKKEVAVMLLTVERVDVWAVDLDDRPGALDEKLAGLAQAGVNIEFIIARRRGEGSNKAVVFLTPLVGEKQESAGKALGFAIAQGLRSLRVSGPDEPGKAHMVLRALGAEGINLRGVSAATIGREFVMHLAFDSDTDAAKAEQRLARPL